MNIQSSNYVRYSLTGSLNSVYRPLHNLYEKDELEMKSFRSKNLLFDLNHPVHFLVQTSYDNSTNLIINDNQHKPRLINTYFAPTENDSYLLTPHIGDDNTNVYKEANLDLNTSLYKLSYNIPKITFNGIKDGGLLLVGGYVFYIKASDEDGNTTDIIAESGIIPITTDSGGYANMRSDKVISLEISNIDTEYSHIKVYYSRSTSNIHESSVTTCHVIDHLYPLHDDGSCTLIISGFETVLDIDESEINTRYAINDCVRGSAIVNSRLFLANGTVLYADYEMLKDLSVRILPLLQITSTTALLNSNIAEDSISNGVHLFYKSAKNCYNYTGYHPFEIYRFGIVYIYANSSISNVFNVAGVNELGTSLAYNPLDLDVATDELDLIKYSKSRYFGEDDYNLYAPIVSSPITDTLTEGLKLTKLNTKGVCYLKPSSENIDSIYGISFTIPPMVKLKLLDLGIIGYFFVRLKRMPLKLCEFIGTKVNSNSFTPAIPTNGKYQFESFLDTMGRTVLSYDSRLRDYLTIEICTYRKTSLDSKDSGWNPNGKYVHEKGYWGKCTTSAYQTGTTAGFCPDYEMNTAYYNNLFSGNEYRVAKLDSVSWTVSGRIRTAVLKGAISSISTDESRIIGVEDGVSLLAINVDSNNTYHFSSMAGIAADIWGWKGVGGDYAKALNFKPIADFDVNNGKSGSSNDDTFYSSWTVPDNRIRGLFGPYIGLTGDYYNNRCAIYPTNFSESELDTYLKVRMLNKSVYYTIGDRYSISDDIPTQYRGDCFITTVGHRINRNFLDTTSPSNDTIVSISSSGAPVICYTKIKLSGKGSDTIFGDGSANNYALVEKDTVGHNVLTNETLDMGVSYKSNCNIGDLNAVQIGTWVLFKIRSNNNYDLRAEDHTNATEHLQMGGWRTSYPLHSLYYGGTHKIKDSDAYNFGLSISGGVRQYVCIENDSYDSVYFKNRIFYSNVDITSYFVNGYRTFIDNCYKDYDTQYGSITKLISWYGDLLAIFEYGVCLIPVNERITSGEGSGGAIYINTENVLADTPKVLSPIYGTLWEESIVLTPSYVYGIDTKAKKIWQTNGSEIKIISDFKIQSFLNDNLNLHSIKPEIGKVMLKGHYVQYKGDVIFTLYKYKDSDLNANVLWSICYNENTDMWTTLYSWIPSYFTNLRSTGLSIDYTPSRQIYDSISMSETVSAFINDEITNKDSLYLQYTKMYERNTKDSIVEGVIEIQRSDCTDTSFSYTSKTKIKIDTEFEGEKVYVPMITSDNKSEYEDNKNNYIIENRVNLTDNSKLVLLLLYMTGLSYSKSGQLTIKDTISGKYISFDNTRITLNGYDETARALLIEIYNSEDEALEALENENDTIIYDASNNAFYYKSQESEIYSKYEILSYGPRLKVYKHGFSDFIGYTEKIQPTVWYDKLHPFEVEFVIIDDPETNKIFENLKLLSNKAEPESFHYEIVGEVYDFAKDKLNAYYRLEKLKNLWYNLYSSKDFAIKYDPYYIELLPKLKLKPLYHYEDETIKINTDYKDENGNTLFAKSFSPWYYYSRVHNPNEIENYYYQAVVENKNYDGLGGTEIVWDRRLDDFKLNIHSKGVDVCGPGGVLRGNMQYLENCWYVTIPTIQYKEKNETEWITKSYNEQTINVDSSTLIKIPAGNYPNPPILPLIAPTVLNLSDCVYSAKSDYATIDINLIDSVAREMLLTDTDFDYDSSSWGNRQETQIEDKYMKVRIRYSGRDKVLLQAIKTFYTVTNA